VRDEHSAQSSRSLEASGGARRSVGWYLLLVAPGLWVMAVLGVGFGLHMGAQFVPLLTAAPVIACAGTVRRLCIVLGCACALIALTPIPDQPIALGERISTASAVVIVTYASYFVAHRRIRMQQAYDEVWQIAEVTQRVLLRPIPERIGPVATAVEYLSAATGARVGGDFYEIIDTPYGVRAILGDMRGHGLDAVSGAAALLGAFREAGAVEPTLEAVAARLDAALTRHTTGSRRAEVIVGRRDEFHGGGIGSGSGAGTGTGSGSGWGEGMRDVGSESGAREVDEGQLWAEDFATAVLVQVPYGQLRSLSDSADGYGEEGSDHRGRGGSDSGSGGGLGSAGEAGIVVCGHPAPYLIRDGATVALEPEWPTLPLGLGSLVDEPYAASSRVVPFGPGDALVFYTDGVCDARASSGEFFQLEGLLYDGFYGCAPQFVAASVRSRLLEHMQHELNDDAALLVLARVGGEN
jgi:stage II sporulation SpoE-like protein